MNKKTIFQVLIVFIMLSVLGVITTHAEAKIVISTYNSTNVPIWSEDDKWIYDIQYKGGFFGDILTINWVFEDIEFKVSDTSDPYYTMSLNGQVTGTLIISGISIIRGTLQDTTIIGETKIQKSTIGMKELNIHIAGKLAISGIPLKSFTMDVDVTFSPAYNVFNFPLEVGNSWVNSISDVTGTLTTSLINNPLYIDDIVGGDNYKCNDLISKTVSAGTFDITYEIKSDGDVTERYYSPEVGNIIKASGQTDYIFSMELLNFIYGTPGSPNTPSKPTGATSGNPGNTYEYSTSTTDNEGDQIYYMFDWGDGTNSGWLGPKNSGEICKSSHLWSKGSYKVKVKAKDSDNHESKWSDSLDVKIQTSKNKPFFNYFNDIISILLMKFIININYQ